ncbi:hypothetical protein BBJ28_00001411 [Nothophytophthora sp. Chile5]|nr:hypothetical protein BBJ28_00001411 [Nothophytophthora sp. Chile5]
MANHNSNSSSEDEWSLVSDGESCHSNMSFDEVEAEPEVAETQHEKPAACDEVAALTLETSEDTDVQSLLADNSSSSRSAAGYSREIRVSLLSSAHQEWLTGSLPSYSPPSSAAVQRKRSIKLAFPAPELRHRSFPDRLRAAMPARHSSSETVELPTYSEVVSFKQDQATQVNFDDVAPRAQASTTALLESALQRSMTKTTQLHAKAQDLERLWLRVTQLEAAAAKAELKAQQDAFKIKRYERSMTLAKQQAQLTSEYHENLKAVSEELRRENVQLKRQNDAFRGDDSTLATRSLDDLEELEIALTRGTDHVRAALRATYRTAVEQRREKELCVVCFAQPVSVVLLPCRHQVLCSACAVRVTTCPIDRQDIRDKVLTYGLDAYTD